MHHTGSVDSQRIASYSHPGTLPFSVLVDVQVLSKVIPVPHTDALEVYASQFATPAMGLAKDLWKPVRTHA